MPDMQSPNEPRPQPLHIPELLAPAGGRAQFFAALNSGADAVFLGLKTFNARARAENFSIEDLQDLVPLAHHYGMKVLVTLNILIKDVELDSLLEQLSKLSRLNVDAIIVQDLGVARIVKNFFPTLRMHASTQLAVHNVHGVLQAMEAGFKRVVLARELTAVEMKRIRDAVPRDKVEIEAFCHGSLCYSYSGLCFFSGADHARSGNRGECAYTCREPYKIVSEPGQGFVFSMRDLDTADHLEKFIDAGLDTLKIEGRKKDAQFVSSVVKLYRQKLDDALGVRTLRENAPPAAQAFFKTPHNGKDLRADLKLSFSRKPTSFFLLNRYKENVIDLDNPSHAGIELGVVNRVRADARGDLWIRVKLRDSLERFDGLSLKPEAKVFHALPQDGLKNRASLKEMMNRYDREEHEFSARDILFNSKRVVCALAGSEVEVLVSGADKSSLSVGMVVRKIRSSSLKAKVDALTQPPPDRRLRAEVPFTVHVCVGMCDDERVSVDLKAQCGPASGFARLEFDATDQSPAMDWSSFLKKEFAILGPRPTDTSPFYFVCDHLSVDEEATKSISRSDVKQLKSSLRNLLLEIFDTEGDPALAACESSWANEYQSLASASVARLSVKIDDLSYLDYLGDLLERDAKAASSVCDLVFEPKQRGPIAIPDMLDTLHGFCGKYKISLRLAMPTVIRAWDEPLLRQWIRGCEALGIRSYEVGNIGAKAFLVSCGVDVDRCHFNSDFSFYALNREAVAFASEHGVSGVTLSIEDDSESLFHLLRHWPAGGKTRPQSILYKDTPLFIAESCSLTALHNGCPTAKVCGYRTLEIENRHGERFFVGHEGCKSIVYGKQAYAVSQFKQQLMEQGVEDFRVDFLTRPYDKITFQKVLLACLSGQPIAGTHSANFNRELL